MARLTYHPTPDPPEDMGVLDGLSYALFLPENPLGGLVILHGAGSSKLSHFDFARAARDARVAAVAFDIRGHGESVGDLGDGVIDDIRTMRTLLPDGPLALRGSSMGGYLALVAAGPLRADAVVAICPAGSEHLVRGLRERRFGFDADYPQLERFLTDHDPRDAVAALDVPLMILHAEGDEQIPIAHSAELHRLARSPRKRFIAMPGGHHRSIQHDAELQGAALRFVLKAFRGG